MANKDSEERPTENTETPMDNKESVEESLEKEFQEEEVAEEKKSDSSEKSKRKKNSSDKPAVDRQYRRMERSAKFWNRIDPANRFRHWYLGTVSITRSLFRVAAAWQTIAILVTILVVLYILAAFYTGRGEFVVKINREIAEYFLLSETTDFSERLVTLRNDAVSDATNITLADIPRDVMEVNGKHNGRSYVAYTFYLLNDSERERDYRFELSVLSTSKDADTATWVMLFRNGEQQIYAQPNSAGYPECLYSKWEFPFREYAANPDYMFSIVEDAKTAHVTEEMVSYHAFTDIEGLHELKTVPWENDTLVCSGIRSKIQPQEIDKFTVVVWIEGDDPDCKNNIIGGHVEMSMNFY